MTSWMKSMPPRMEIADLDIQESDPRYPDAVKCVQTYWKQAIHMTYDQRKRYLGFLDTRSKVDYLSKTPGVTSHILYTSARNYLGEIPTKNIRWADYLFLTSLYKRLPDDYLEAVAARYSTTTIWDYTEEYRDYYPEPTLSSQDSTTESTKISDPLKIDLTQNEEMPNKQQNISVGHKDNGVPIESIQKQSATSTQRKELLFGTTTAIQKQDTDTNKKNDNETRASTSQQQANPSNQKQTIILPRTTSDQQQDATPTRKKENETPSSGLGSPPEALASTEPMVPETWNIDNVVGILSLQNKKRLCPAPESSSKRARLDGDEILEKVNQQAEIIQQAMDKLQCNQDIKLQEVREAVEQNRQALESMQSELRQFMSAVASTLRHIQERLDE
ncbi:hypothetical protein TrVGV298_010758 [Trichoderma virens]|nr:hypothetical protein TrVGV298_010758 [Trichoderma virens]